MNEMFGDMVRVIVGPNVVAPPCSGQHRCTLTESGAFVGGPGDGDFRFVKVEKIGVGSTAYWRAKILENSPHPRNCAR